MRVVVALGGNALLKRGEPMTAENQRSNVRAAAPALASVAKEHQLVLSHGNGPQVGLLALQAAAYEEVDPYPLDVLGAQTEGMIGYVLEQELGNAMPPDVPLATDPHDGAGRPGRPGVRGPDQVRRPDLHPGRGGPARGRQGLGVQAGRRQLAPGRALTPAAAHLRDPADPVAARARRRAHLRRRRWGAHDVPAGRGDDAGRRRGRHRQGPRQRAARPRGRRRPVRDGDRRRRRVRRLGHAAAAGARPGDAPPSCARASSRPARWGRRSRRRAASSRPPGGGPRSARSPRSSRSSTERRAPRWCAGTEET